MKYEIVKLRECPERKDEAAVWFHEKWGYPLEAYRESMEECLAGGGPVPQWYMAVAEGRIIRRFMSGMDGSFFAWPWGMGRTGPAGCTGGPAGRSCSDLSLRFAPAGTGAYFSCERKVPKGHSRNYVP